MKFSAMPSSVMAQSSLLPFRYLSPSSMSRPTARTLTFSASSLGGSFIFSAAMAAPEKKNVPISMAKAHSMPSPSTMGPARARPMTVHACPAPPLRAAPSVYFSLESSAGMAQAPAGMRSVSSVEMSATQTKSVGVLSASRYTSSAISATTAPRAKSIHTMTAFLSMRSTTAPAMGCKMMVGR